MADFDRIRAEQIRTLCRLTPLGVSSAGGIALLVAIAGHGRDLSNARAIGWGLGIGLCALVHIGLCEIYRRTAPPDAVWRPWMRWFTLMALIEGIGWGFGAVLLTSADDSSQALVILVAWAGVCSGGALVFGAYLPTYLAFFIPTMLPHLWLTLRYRYPHFELLAGLEIVFLTLMPLIALQLSRQLVGGMRLRFANLDLAEDLQTQKMVAEQANLAKSQFLAAASHDLRQPVHALGLFVGALRGRRMDAESRRLLDQIDMSVAALDELFSGLLDISKLDAGAVQPRIETVAIDHTLERLCRDYGGEARAKGIALRHHPGAACVESDPVLLERILRNILSNAVRYTDRGGVLMGCRLRGAKVAIEIWDTGRGIPASEHERIFQEFYQIGNPERDRTKGVGLGLAIVRRTADLLGAGLEFRSVPGRGSMFRVTVPRGTRTVAAVQTDLAAPPVKSAMICVIDDDLAIRDAMHSLLTGWGHRVEVAGSEAEMVARMAQISQRPDLLICDYRLPGADPGTVAITTLRQHFKAIIPAIVITGDTAPHRIAEAQASGFVLLHKPLSSGKLRAAVGNMLRQSSAD